MVVPSKIPGFSQRPPRSSIVRKKLIRRSLVVLVALAMAAPRMVFAALLYPPSERMSYSPLATSCSPSEMAELAAELGDEEQQAAAFRALTVCGAEAVPLLLRLLGDPALQSQALDALIDMGPEAQAALPDLTRRLQGRAGDLRSQLPYAIAVIGQQQAVPILLPVLNHPDTTLAQRAASALGRVGPEAAAAVPALRAALQRSEIATAATGALGDIGPAAQAAVPDLVARLGREESGYNTAVVALGNIGAAAVPRLIDAVASPNPDVRLAAVDALRRVEPAYLVSAVPALTRALGDEALQFYAADALSEIGPAAVTAAPVLASLLREESVDWPVRAALANIGEGAVPSLIAVLESRDPQGQANAVQVLAQIGPGAAAAVPALRAMLGQNAATLEVVRALGAIGPEARAATPDLLPLLESDHQPTRLIAALALGNIGPDAVPKLIELLQRGDSQVQVLAALSLGQMGPAAQAAVPALTDLLTPVTARLEPRSKLMADRDLGDVTLPRVDPTLEPRPRPRLPERFEPLPPVLTAPTARPNRVAISAALALGNIGAPVEAAVPHLIYLLRHPSPDIQAQAALALGKMGETAQTAVPDLINVMGAGGLTDFSPVLRARDQATQALIAIGAPAADPLVQALGSDSPIAYARAARVLAEIGKPAIPSLVEALADSRLHVRRRAAFALGQMDAAAVPALVNALQPGQPEGQRAAAAAALGQAEAAALGIPILQATVADTNNSLELRRVAAAALDQLGEDGKSFLAAHDFLGPSTAACPSVGFSRYEFDLLTGDCLVVHTENVFLAGLGDILGPLCNLLGC